MRLLAVAVRKPLFQYFALSVLTLFLGQVHPKPPSSKDNGFKRSSYYTSGSYGHRGDNRHGPEENLQATYIMDGGDDYNEGPVSVYSWNRLLDEATGLRDEQPKLEYTITDHDDARHYIKHGFAIFSGDKDKKQLLQSADTHRATCRGKGYLYPVTSSSNHSFSYQILTKAGYKDQWKLHVREPGGLVSTFTYFRKQHSRTGRMYTINGARVASVKWTTPDKKGDLAWQYSKIPKEHAIQFDVETSYIEPYAIAGLLVMIKKRITRCGY